jgi:hypothetical protein
MLLPAPSKLFFYPDELLDSDMYAEIDASVRLDRKYYELYKLFRERGIEVIDIYPEFKRRISEMDKALYRKDDHHWSGYGNREVAKIISRQIEDSEWLEEIPKRDYRISERRERVVGGHWSRTLSDWEGAEDGLPPPDYPLLEILSVQEVQADGSLINSLPSRESPILLLGDSFVMNLSTGDVDYGAGVRNHLSELLGIPIDALGVAGGGANEARVDLALDDGRLDDKKVVIWMLSSMDFTHLVSREHWKIIPLPKILSESSKN